MFLGSSEGVIGNSELFRDVDAKHRLYQRVDGTVPTVVFPLAMPGDTPAASATLRRAAHDREMSVGVALEHIALEYAPPSLMITEQGTIINASGETSVFLQLPRGAASLNIIDQARQGLRIVLRSAIREAVSSRQPVIRENVVVRTPDGLRPIDLVVRPVAETHKASNLLAVVFQPAKSRDKGRGAVSLAEDLAVRQLESELSATQSELQAMTRDRQTAHEGQQSGDEELLSLNEEMQSANEELQASKEEMQAVNEELATVNAELNRKIEQLDGSNADLQNLIRSTEIATLFLDRDLRIKRFTPAATALFRLRDGDLGRPISDFAPRFAEGDLTGRHEGSDSDARHQGAASTHT